MVNDDKYANLIKPLDDAYNELAHSENGDTFELFSRRIDEIIQPEIQNFTYNPDLYFFKDNNYSVKMPNTLSAEIQMMGARSFQNKLALRQGTNEYRASFESNRMYRTFIEYVSTLEDLESGAYSVPYMCIGGIRIPLSLEKSAVDTKYSVLSPVITNKDLLIELVYGIKSTDEYNMDYIRKQIAALEAKSFENAALEIQTLRQFANNPQLFLNIFSPNFLTAITDNKLMTKADLEKWYETANLINEASSGMGDILLGEKAYNGSSSAKAGFRLDVGMAVEKTYMDSSGIPNPKDQSLLFPVEVNYDNGVGYQICNLRRFSNGKERVYFHHGDQDRVDYDRWLHN